MRPDIESLAREAAELEDALKHLGEELVDAGTQLQGGGAPPSDGLIAEQVKLLREFEGLRARVLAISEALALESPSIEQVMGLADLLSLIVRVTEAESRRASFDRIRRRSVAVLDRVARLSHADGQHFSPLSDCKALAADLRQQIEQAGTETPSEEAARLAAGEHPFSDLLDLAEDQKTLSDDEFAHKERSILTAFGDPLRLAVLRGRITHPATAAPSQVVEDLASGARPEAQGTETPPSPSRATEGGERRPSLRLTPPRPTDRGGSKRPKRRGIENIFDSSPGYAFVPLTAVPSASAPPAIESGGGDSQRADGVEDAPTVPNPAETASPPEPGGINLKARGDGKWDEEAGPATFPTERVDNRASEADQQAVLDGTNLPPSDLGKLHPAPDTPRTDGGDGIGPATAGPNTSVDDLAELALRSAPSYDPRTLLDVVSGLIRDRRYGLAYHLARCLETLAPAAQQRIPPELVRAVALGRHVRFEVGGLASVLTQDFAAIADDSARSVGPSQTYAIHILRAASALRPALLAPRTGASRVLHTLHLPGLDTLFSYCQTIARFGDRLNPLDTNALKSVKDDAAWEEQLASSAREASRWVDQAQHRSLAFVGATKVLHRWLNRGGLLHRLLDPVLHNDRQRLQEVAQEAERLSLEAQIRREVSETDRPATGHKPRGEPIVATSYTQLKERVHEAVAIARRWVEVHASRPERIPAHQQRLANELRRELGNSHEAVLAELRAFEEEADHLTAMAAATACRDAVESIRQIFDKDAEVRADEPNLRFLLHGELLLAPGLTPDEEWGPTGLEARDLAGSILKVLADPGRSWRAAYDDHMAQRDHRATAMVIEYLEAYAPDSTPLANELARSRPVHLRECREALRRDCDFTRKELETATSLGLIREEERARHDGIIASIESALEEVERFGLEEDQLRDIANALRQKRHSAVTEARDRLERSGIGADHPDRPRIEEVLERGDVFTANEYIQALLDGQTLPINPDQPDRFGCFFPDHFRQLEDHMAKRADRPEQEIVAKIRNCESMPGLNMREVPGSQAQRAAKMLETWFAAKKQKRITEDQVRTILDTIGFRTQRALVRTTGQRTRVEVVTDPLRDRDLCPIDAFGSLADGQYRIICDWGRPNEEDLLNELNESARDAAYIVFYFGRLTEARRRNLARLCHDPKRRRKIVVLDDILLIHLCGERGSRLPVFFDCTLPFSFAMPYTTAASLVSPEMFYGRSREIEDIIDAMGTCFIFGGRQLGKTALLRHVERSFLMPMEDRHASWIDLKERGIGYALGADQIRVALADELKRHMVIPATVPHNTGLDRILEHVRTWIDANPKRRLLLLLDEADNFLELDAEEGFAHTDRFRGLMVATNRRFKVVFAGLHNVQRTTRQANHPLAHFGEARSIGPLIHGRDARDARDLIERPLRSLGYRFETDDLVTRILAQTNYYPSLIQLFCNALLKHLAELHDGFDPRTTPPFIITSRHLQDVYQDKELRKSIRDKLSLTLRLDPRYEVIAYVIANGFLDDRTRAMTRGFPASWIREESLYWYPDGFPDTAEDSFRVLLDEMIGLGVLREVDPGYYTLRSPNVASLLGTEPEVMAVLTRERIPPPVYEPATFRSAYRGDRGSEPSRRSPLTAEQVSVLRRRENGVSLIVGSTASGLEDVSLFLKLDYPDEFFVDLDAIEKTEFARRLAELDSRAREGVVLILVRPSCQWDKSWIDMAMGKTGRLTSVDSFVRVAFLADPAKIWRLTGWEATQPRLCESRGLTTLELKPWHDAALAHWLADCDFSITDEQQSEVTRVTGNWPLLLCEFHVLAKNDTVHWGDHLKELESRLGDRAEAVRLLEAFGIEDRRDRLVLRTLHELQEPDGSGVSVDDLAALTEDVSTDYIRRTLRWADLLQIAHPVGTGHWRIDPLVGRLVSTAAENMAS